MDKILRDNTYFIDGDVRLEMNHVTPIGSHTHDFIEFVYMMKGRSVHWVDGEEYPLTAGDLLIINYGETHRFDGDPSATFCNILVKPAFLDDSMRDCRDLFLLLQSPQYREFGELVDSRCRCIRFSPEEKNCFAYMLLLLEREQQSGALGSDRITRSGVGFLLVMILRKMCVAHPPVKDAFQQVLDYIGSHYAERIEAARLAAMCYYTPSYFSRVFKHYTGVTFSEYLKRVRILNACRLIEQDGRVGDVYVRVGYTNKTNFYRHFRAIMGVTPRAYRQGLSR